MFEMGPCRQSSWEMFDLDSNIQSRQEIYVLNQCMLNSQGMPAEDFDIHHNQEMHVKGLSIWNM